MKKIIKENGEIWEVNKDFAYGVWHINKNLIGTYDIEEPKDKKRKKVEE